MVPSRTVTGSNPLAGSGRDRRVHKRVPLRLKGRFLDNSSQDHTITTLNISCSGALIESPFQPDAGVQIVCYFNDLGRVSATVIRSGPDAFAVQFKTAEHKRDKLADRLTWLLNKDRLDLDEERVTPRHSAGGPAIVTLADGRELKCRALDISLTGASFEAESTAPMVGDIVTAGNVRGEVVRVALRNFAIRYLR